VGLTWDRLQKILYVDDVDAASDMSIGAGNTRDGLYIGAGSALEAGTLWAGLIDDVRIYSHAVTP